MLRKENILSFTLPALQNLLVEEMKVPAYTASQIFDWIYVKGVTQFEAMTNLSKDLRAKLTERVQFEIPKEAARLRSKDGKTLKFKFTLLDGKEIETVLMRDGEKATLCLSSQVGCAQGCIFCATGKMGIIRNLSAGEITGQVLACFQHFRGKLPKSLRVVMMGMGEPFHNIKQVFKALDILTEAKGLNIGARKITVSTSGVVKGIYRLMELHPQVQLAISLHTVDPELRKLWVPSQSESVDEILEAARAFTKTTNRKITFEIVLFGGDLMSSSKINRLGKAIHGILCNVNIIPYNPIPDAPSELLRPTPKEIHFFSRILKSWQEEITVRKSKGRDIQAACGQLIVTRAA
jgi:23S rRNA (adenine2503-C2)-methyltransferase